MMIDTMTHYLAGLMGTKDRWAHRKLLIPLFDRQTSRPLNTAGLVIHGSAGTVPKTGAVDQYLIVNGVLLKIAAATDMPVLAGTVTNATFNVFCFFLDGAGTKTSQMGTAGATLGAVKFPQFPKQKALIGFIIINPTGTGDFVGGTTALDDATVAPGAVYVSPTAGFDPYALIGGA